MPDEAMSSLNIRDLKVTFETPLGIVKAIDEVSFELKAGETLALVGETGCGKSVVAHSILKLLPVNAQIRGQILFRNQNLLKLGEKELAQIRGKEISLIMQNPALALNPVYSIGHQMTEPLMVHEGMRKAKAILKAKDLLKRLRFIGPDAATRAYPFEMSGGMKQRILIGISVILNPKIIIADEPTTGLDSHLRDMVLEELRLVKEMDRSSMIFISHDLNAAREISDRIAIMYAGEILEIGPTVEFFKEPFHPYSKKLQDSLPEQGFNPIPGISPSVIHPPEGCKFHPRCPSRKEICSKESPDFVRIKDRDIKCVLYS
jgi:peptide/nickel transport system ATP-binding protein